jgi:hypothetical protein
MRAALVLPFSHTVANLSLVATPTPKIVGLARANSGAQIF